MKKAYQYIALAAAAFSFAACTQEDDFTPQGNQKDAPLAIASAGVAELTTRVITDKTELVGTADEYASLGVFITGGSETKYNTNNMKWVHDGMGWTSGETVLFEGAASKQQIAAYSPYNASLYGNTFHIDMDDQSDYLYCEYAPLTSNPAAITMKHLFAKVTVTIPYESFGTSVTNSTVGKVELVNVPVTADWTVPGAELDNYGPSDGEIWLRSEGSTGVFTGYALPNGATSLFLRITMADGNSIYTATVSLDDAETTDETEVLTGGTHYNIGLRVGRDKVDIAHVHIEPWSTGGELEGGEAEEIHYKYDEETNTYIVRNAEGLQQWNKKVQEIFATAVVNYMGQLEYAEPFPNLTLEADITLTGENNWTPLGGRHHIDEYGEYDSYYNGVIDGQGHTITGLRINSNSQYQGFIGRLDYRATVKNLTFADAVVSGGGWSGIVVGEAQTGRIENCHVTSGSLTTTGENTGGIVGYNMATVINCTNAATIAVAEGVTDALYMGGIAGGNIGAIMGCINTGAISGNRYVGGVVGEHSNSTGIVVACSNKEVVTGSDINSIGGIMGSQVNNSKVYGSWTITTTESDTTIDGIGNTNINLTTMGCFSGDVATINGKVSEMNAAIATYNETATEGKTCPFIWQVDEDGYPTLVEKSE